MTQKARKGHFKIEKISLGSTFSSSLEEIVPGAIRNINASEVFAESLRSELNNYKYQPLLEGTDEFCVLKTLYDDSPSDSRILFISVLMRA